jgi:hypothetical protein
MSGCTCAGNKCVAARSSIDILEERCVASENDAVIVWCMRCVLNVSPSLSPFHLFISGSSQSVSLHQCQPPRADLMPDSERQSQRLA